MGVLGAYVVLGLRRRLPVAPVVGLLVAQFPDRLHGRHRLAGPPRAAWSPAPSWPSLYDYAGGLRDRTTALALTVGGSVAVLAVLALLITVDRPGPRQPQLSGRATVAGG